MENRNLPHFISVISTFITTPFYIAPVSSFIIVIERSKFKQGNVSASVCQYDPKLILNSNEIPTIFRSF